MPIAKQPPKPQVYEVYNIDLVRNDNETQEEVERYPVWQWEDLPPPNGTLGGLIYALNYTTSYVAQANGEQFDIIRVRNDPYSEAHITPDITVDTIDAPGEDDLTLVQILQQYKNNTSYQYTQIA